MTKKKIPRVMAVGLSVLNPDFVVVFHAYSPREDDKVYAYPPRQADEEGGEDFEVPEPEDGERNFVILTAPDRYQELRPWANRIYRLLICGKGQLDQLLDLDVPIIDAHVKNGRVVSSISFDTADDLHNLIEDEAQPLQLGQKRKKSRKKKRRKKATTPKEKPEEQPEETDELDSELLPMLREIREQFDGEVVEFENAVLIPTVFRLIKEMDRAEFKERCKWLESNGIDKHLCRQLYRYMERKRDRGEGGGLKLSRAVQKYLTGEKKVDALVRSYGLPARDIRWVANAVRKLEADAEAG